jgi:hypothetical protein
MRAVNRHVLFMVIASALLVQSESDSCVPGNTGGYGSMNECSLRGIQSKPLRVAYLDKQYVTQNQVVISKMNELNKPYVFASTCEKDATAIPEWYFKLRLSILLHFDSMCSTQFCC